MTHENEVTIPQKRNDNAPAWKLVVLSLLFTAGICAIGFGLAYAFPQKPPGPLSTGEQVITAEEVMATYPHKRGFNTQGVPIFERTGDQCTLGEETSVQIQAWTDEGSVAVVEVSRIWDRPQDCGDGWIVRVPKDKLKRREQQRGD